MATKFFMLQEGTYETEIANNGAEAIAKYQTFKPDVVILDIAMPIMDGIQTLTKLREMDETASVIMASASGSSENIDLCLKKGAKGFVEKPFSPDELLTTINNVIKAGTSGKDLVTVFSLAGNKMESSFRKMTDSESAMKLLDVVMNEAKQSQEITYSGQDTSQTQSVSEVDEIETIEVPDTSFGFSCEISGQQNGVVVAVINRKDLYVLCGKEPLQIPTPQDKDDFLEIFNILNNNIMIQISEFMGSKVQLGPPRYFDKSKDNAYPGIL